MSHTRVFPTGNDGAAPANNTFPCVQARARPFPHPTRPPSRTRSHPNARPPIHCRPKAASSRNERARPCRSTGGAGVAARWGLGVRAGQRRVTDAVFSAQKSMQCARPGTGAALWPRASARGPRGPHTSGAGGCKAGGHRARAAGSMGPVAPAAVLGSQGGEVGRTVQSEHACSSFASVRRLRSASLPGWTHGAFQLCERWCSPRARKLVNFLSASIGGLVQRHRLESCAEDFGR